MRRTQPFEQVGYRHEPFHLGARRVAERAQWLKAADPAEKQRLLDAFHTWYCGVYPGYQPAVGPPPTADGDGARSAALMARWLATAGAKRPAARAATAGAGAGAEATKPPVTFLERWLRRGAPRAAEAVEGGRAAAP
jgi:hypothetical protein